ncbi:hypothetical protein BTM25_07530 [Actinomadura rubteroloni]|uniref:Lipoprotein n=1 Tax=Actinomadura rubteroloni TaxID=1926885 RepID=A0A2P4UMT0_9ACTN|nr:PGRS family protein [Actinomadura rubteroloni]POM26356.1 hypothetical protein BTM25_07530 [Actinomadura rubteroloni]
MIMNERKSTKRYALAGLTGALLITLAGCDSSTKDKDPAASAAAAPTTSAPKPAPKKPMTAADVLKALEAAGLPIKTTVVYTAKTDPNEMLGKEGKYTSKATCADERVNLSKVRDRSKGNVDLGCDVEVFATNAGAQARSAYIKASIAAVGILTKEYHLIKGGVLLRISGILTKKQAAAYKTPLMSLPV